MSAGAKAGIIMKPGARLLSGWPGAAAIFSAGLVVADMMDGPGHLPVAVGLLVAAFASLSTASQQCKTTQQTRVEILENSFSAPSGDVLSPKVEKAEVQIANTSKYALQSASAPKENSEVEKTASVLAATTRLLAASISDSSKSLESEPQTPLSSGPMEVSFGSGKGKVLCCGRVGDSEPSPAEVGPSGLVKSLVLLATCAFGYGVWLCLQGASIFSTAPGGLCVGALVLYGLAFLLQAKR